MDKKSAETVVKVFGIIGIVFAVLGLLGGLLVIVFGTAFGGMISTMAEEMLPGALLGGVIIGAGVFMLLISALMIFLYVKLMKYANWARIVLLVLAILGFVGALVSFPWSLLQLAYYGAFIYFFAIDKTVIALYNK